jgi:hypothetical protein
MDLSQLMQMAGQLRSQMAEAQEAAGRERFTGEAGGGLVRVVLNGRYEALEVHIDATAAEPADRSLLEDLLRAAFNQAAAKTAQGLQGRIADFARQMGVDPSMLGGLGQ